MKCMIVGAGEFEETALPVEDGDFLIAADGGLVYLEKLHIRPHMVIGDFDSLKRLPVHPNVLKLPVVKDDTDMGAAIAEGERRGYDTFYLYGGCGGRIDHTLANLQLMARLAKAGKEAVLIGNRQEIRIVQGPARMVYPPDTKGTISVLAYSERCTGVYERGFQYSLTDYTMTNDVPLGVSNAFIGEEATLSVETGLMLIITERRSKEAAGSKTG